MILLCWLGLSSTNHGRNRIAGIRGVTPEDGQVSKDLFFLFLFIIIIIIIIILIFFDFWFFGTNTVNTNFNNGSLWEPF